ncbi:MAG: lipopolysaccharide transport periplasmic protein LptA [Pseudomonadota bacterium]|nr:lipopolysaccharide transport periplasmic protein LptA [Pseudomonadota bacterium]
MIRKLLLLIILTPCASFALTTDASQEIHITSNTVEYSHHEHTITYLGNVIATQGSTKVTGERAVVTINAKNRIDHISAYGKPATYSTLLKPNEPPVVASGNTIQFYPEAGRLELIQQGHIKQNGNTFAAPYIVYDVKTQTLHSNPTGTGRTTVVLQPQGTS